MSSRAAGKGSASVELAGIEHRYKDTLLQEITKHRKYPRQARRKRSQGVVLVFFVLQRNGDVSELRVLEGSGIKSLDKAALDAVRNVGQFPPFPAGVERAQWEFEFPVHFKLQ
ncbi:MAG: energy transducer TonB [Granulosicoccaceae bacterium]